MSIRMLKISPKALGAVLALGLAGVSLAGCVYYPTGPAYGYAYAPGYYAPAYVAPPVVVYGGGYVGGGYGWRGGGWGGGHWHH